MSRLRPIHGACNCGRNLYSIVVPENAVEQAEVYFDDSSESSKLLSLGIVYSTFSFELTISRYRTKPSDSSNRVATNSIAMVLIIDTSSFPRRNTFLDTQDIYPYTRSSLSAHLLRILWDTPLVLDGTTGFRSQVLECYLRKSSHR